MDSARCERAQPPAHVPPDRVFDFDVFHDWRLVGDVEQGRFSLHADAPDIFWTPRNGGHWIATRYADIVRIMQTPELFASAGALIEPKRPLLNLPIPPLDMDPPEHGPHRALVMDFLSPKSVKAIEPEIHGRIDEVLAPLTEKSSCEFVSEVAVPIPAAVFLSIMAWDRSRFREFVDWTNRILRGGDRTPIRPALEALHDFLREIIAERLVRPGDDPVSRMLAAKIDGRRVPPERVHEICNLLFLAGLDTVTSAMTHIMHLLAREPAAQPWLRSNPQKVPHALEELLRRITFLNIPRRVARGCMLNGVRLEEGEMIVSSLRGASNDDGVTADPDRLDFTRRGAPHLAFNTGPHVCAGAVLARFEMRAFLKQWLARMPDVRLAPDFAPRIRGGTIMALERLDIVW